MAGIWDRLSAKLTDTHCHIHHYDQPEIILKTVKSSGMKVHCVTVRPDEFPLCCEQFANYPNIIPSLGLFPLNVKEEGILEKFFELFDQTRFIGEIGLDYSIEEEHEMELQRSVFKKIVSACDKAGNKILSIHSRRSADDVLKIIGPNFNGKAIMHWYSGPVKLIQQAPENIYFSVNTAMLQSRQGKKVIASLGKSQVLTETDGPYVKINDKPAQPTDTKNVVNSLAANWGISIEETMEILQDNYERVVSDD